MSGDRILAPERLTSGHDLSTFESGEASLDDWLRRRALKNDAGGASRTYVACIKNRVVGYYVLAAGTVAHEVAPGAVKHNMPDPVPVMVIGRLGVDWSAQGRGVGRGLLRDAILRILQAGDIVGIRAILVHAISEGAARFYEQHGFSPSPIDPMTLMITVAAAKKALLDEGD